MRSIFAVLIVAVVLATMTPMPGKRTLVVLENDSFRNTHAMFFANLECILLMSFSHYCSEGLHSHDCQRERQDQDFELWRVSVR